MKEAVLLQFQTVRRHVLDGLTQCHDTSECARLELTVDKAVQSEGNLLTTCSEDEGCTLLRKSVNLCRTTRCQIIAHDISSQSSLCPGPGFELRISQTAIRTVITVALPYHKVNTTQRVRPNESCGIIRHQWRMILIRKLNITQGCTNAGRQAVVANKVLYGDAFICSFSVWKFLHVPF